MRLCFWVLVLRRLFVGTLGADVHGSHACADTRTDARANTGADARAHTGTDARTNTGADTRAHPGTDS